MKFTTRLATLSTMLATLALSQATLWGQATPQIEPEAEKLYHRAATALHLLPAYEMEVETVLVRPNGDPGEGFHIVSNVASRQPDRIMVRGTTPFSGQTTIYSDGHTSLIWQESTNQFAKIDAAIPANLLLRITNLTPEAEPVEQTLISAKVLRDEKLDLEGEIFACKVIEVITAGREGVAADLRPRTLWIDTKTGVALKQQTDIVPLRFDKEIPASITVNHFQYGADVDNGDFAFIVPADATEVDWHQLDLAVTNRLLVGKPAPPLHFTTPDGHTLDLARFRGKPVLLHFQTAWCKPCEEGSTVIDSVTRAMGAEVKILRINVEDAASAQAKSLVVSAADLESLGLKAWPANLLIGRDGKVLSYEAGRASEAELMALLRNAASPDAAPIKPAWGVTEPHRALRGPASGKVAPPELVYKVDPGYTSEAGKTKTSGTVMLSILINTDGKVTDIHVLEKLEPSLDARAISAVSKWRFKPATRGETPVPFLARAGVTFSAY